MYGYNLLHNSFFSSLVCDLRSQTKEGAMYGPPLFRGLQLSHSFRLGTATWPTTGLAHSDSGIKLHHNHSFRLGTAPGQRPGSLIPTRTILPILVTLSDSEQHLANDQSCSFRLGLLYPSCAPTPTRNSDLAYDQARSFRLVCWAMTSDSRALPTRSPGKRGLGTGMGQRPIEPVKPKLGTI